jgi:hypothetical protein
MHFAFDERGDAKMHYLSHRCILSKLLGAPRHASARPQDLTKGRGGAGREQHGGLDAQEWAPPPPWWPAFRACPWMRPRETGRTSRTMPLGIGEVTSPRQHRSS